MKSLGKAVPSRVRGSGADLPDGAEFPCTRSRPGGRTAGMQGHLLLSLDASCATTHARHRPVLRAAPGEPVPKENDADPVETREWLDAIEGVIASEGVDRARFLLERLIGQVRKA